MNFQKTYENFIAVKRIEGLSYHEAAHEGFQQHHIIPRSFGGHRGKNLACLTDYDHGYAHLLLNLALLQQGREPLDCGSRRSLKNGNLNLLTYWNPLSKVKIKVTYYNNWKFLPGKWNTSEVLTLKEASKLLHKLWQYSNGNKVFKGSVISKRRKNCLVMNILDIATKSSEKARKSHGVKFECVFD